MPTIRNAPAGNARLVAPVSLAVNSFPAPAIADLRRQLRASAGRKRDIRTFDVTTTRAWRALLFSSSLLRGMRVRARDRRAACKRLFLRGAYRQRQSEALAPAKWKKLHPVAIIRRRR